MRLAALAFALVMAVSLTTLAQTDTPTETPTDTPTDTATETPTVTDTPTASPSTTPTPSTFTVDSTGDGGDISPGDGVCDDGTGHCTLRAAIEEVNALGTGTVHWNIDSSTDAGCNATTHVCTTTPATDLPDITAAGSVFDASTQPFENCGDLWGGTQPAWKVVVQGDSSRNTGIHVAPGTTGVTIRGFEVVGFLKSTVCGIHSEGDSTTITCNWTDGNDLGIKISSATNGEIGGGAGDGNLVTNSTVDGITLNMSSNVSVEGNFVGVLADGVTPAGNEDGIYVLGANTLTKIGSTVAGRGNLSSGNRHNGVSLNGCTGTTVEDNYLGTDITGTVAVPNGQYGAKVSDTIPDTGDIIGGPTTASRNVISGNTLAGIRFNPGATAATAENNYVGVAVDGVTNLCNNAGGIQIDDQGSGNTIVNNTLGCTVCCIFAGSGCPNSPTCVDGIEQDTCLSGFEILPNCFGIAGAVNNTCPGTGGPAPCTGATFTPTIGPSPTITPTAGGPSHTPTRTPTRTPTPSETPTITDTPTITLTPTQTPTPTLTPTTTATPTTTCPPLPGVQRLDTHSEVYDSLTSAIVGQKCGRRTLAVQANAPGVQCGPIRQAADAFLPMPAVVPPFILDWENNGNFAAERDIECTGDGSQSVYVTEFGVYPTPTPTP